MTQVEDVSRGIGGSSSACFFLSRFRGCGAGLEAEAVISGLNDMAMMGQPIEQCRRHCGIAGPFGEAAVRGNNDAGLLVELGEQLEQERAAGWAEGQLSELIEDHEIKADKTLGQLSGLVRSLRLLERIDQIEGQEEPRLFAGMLDSLDAKRRCNVGLAGSRATNQDDVVGAGKQLMDHRLVDLAGREPKAARPQTAPKPSFSAPECKTEKRHAPVTRHRPIWGPFAARPVLATAWG